MEISFYLQCFPVNHFRPCYQRQHWFNQNWAESLIFLLSCSSLLAFIISFALYTIIMNTILRYIGFSVEDRRPQVCPLILYSFMLLLIFSSEPHKQMQVYDNQTCILYHWAVFRYGELAWSPLNPSLIASLRSPREDPEYIGWCLYTEVVCPSSLLYVPLIFYNIQYHTLWSLSHHLQY